MGAAIGSVVAMVWLGCVLAGLYVTTRRGDRRASRSPASVRGYLLVLPLIVVAGVGLFAVGPLSRPVQVGAITFAVAAVGSALFALTTYLVGYDPEADQIAGRLSSDPAARLLLSRWLLRCRWRRWLGGMLGFVFGVCLLDNALHLSRPVICGLAGLAAGSWSAELHHLARVRDRLPRTAELVPRRMAAYTVRSEQTAVMLLGAAAAALTATSAFLHRPAGTWWAGGALASTVLIIAFQYRIVSRRRPGLPPELHQADDLLRRLATSRAVARPGLALGLALLAQAAGALHAHPVSLACWLAAVAVFWHNRRLGLGLGLGQADNPARAAVAS